MGGGGGGGGGGLGPEIENVGETPGMIGMQRKKEQKINIQHNAPCAGADWRKNVIRNRMGYDSLYTFPSQNVIARVLSHVYLFSVK